MVVWAGGGGGGPGGLAAGGGAPRGNTDQQLKQRGNGHWSSGTHMPLTLFFLKKIFFLQTSNIKFAQDTNAFKMSFN